MGYHDQGRLGTDLRTASLRPRTMETGLGELAQDRRAWNASVRDVVNAIGDAASGECRRKYNTYLDSLERWQIQGERSHGDDKFYSKKPEREAVDKGLTGSQGYTVQNTNRNIRGKRETHGHGHTRRDEGGGTPKLSAEISGGGQVENG